MTLDQIKTILQTVPGMADKVIYYAWPEDEAPPLPFICYWQPSSDNFAADGIVYYSAPIINVELYSSLRDLTLEALIEQALTTSGIYWDKEINYIDSERCYMTTYTLEV